MGYFVVRISDERHQSQGANFLFSPGIDKELFSLKRGKKFMLMN
jgi:2-keto-3-deoxy-6-phosphogluconate aldolase